MGHKRKGNAAKLKRLTTAEINKQSWQGQLKLIDHNYGLHSKDLYDVVKERLEEQDCS